MTAVTLSHRETWLRMGVSQATFYRLQREGRFDKLKAPLPGRYSLERVDAWIASRSVSDRPLQVV